MCWRAALHHVVREEFINVPLLSLPRPAGLGTNHQWFRVFNPVQATNKKKKNDLNWFYRFLGSRKIAMFYGALYNGVFGNV